MSAGINPGTWDHWGSAGEGCWQPGRVWALSGYEGVYLMTFLVSIFSLSFFRFAFCGKVQSTYLVLCTHGMAYYGKRRKHCIAFISGAGGIHGFSSHVHSSSFEKADRERESTNENEYCLTFPVCRLWWILFWERIFFTLILLSYPLLSDENIPFPKSPSIHNDGNLGQFISSYVPSPPLPHFSP